MPRSKKTPGERSGELPLQFVTGSHPDEFKDISARQSVRSHVMRDFRRRQSQSPRPSARSSKADLQRTSSAPKARIQARSLLLPSGLHSSLSPASQEYLTSSPPCDHAPDSQIQLNLPGAVSDTITIPTFVHPSLRARSLCFPCLCSFTNDNRSTSGSQTGNQDHIAVLSSICSEFCRRDLLLHNLGKGRDSLAVESDVIQILNENLTRTDNVADHQTIFAITYLIMSETMEGDSTILDMHISGFEAIARRRGGLQSLPLGIATVATAQILVTDILFEKEPPLIYPPEILRAVSLPWSTDAVPESPTYTQSPTPRQQQDPPAHSCLAETSNILQHMQALTAQLLAESLDESEARRVSYNAAAAWESLVALPHASTLLAPEPEKAMYEAIRIAGLIYATALSHSVPISAATTLAATKLGITPTALLENTFNALYSTDLSRLWDDMSQALLWVSLVSGTAAGGEEGKRDVQPPSERARLRRWLSFPAMACLNLLATGQADGFLVALQTMVRVQRVLRRRAEGRDSW